MKVRKRFKNRMLQSQYERWCREGAVMGGANTSKTAYVSGFSYPDLPSRQIAGTFTYAAWRAGVDNRRAKRFGENDINTFSKERIDFPNDVMAKVAPHFHKYCVTLSVMPKTIAPNGGGWTDVHYTEEFLEWSKKHVGSLVDLSVFINRQNTGLTEGFWTHYQNARREQNFFFLNEEIATMFKIRWG
jgi:hypothetical protein